MIEDVQNGQTLMAYWKAQWDATSSPTERVIIAGRVLDTFGSEVVDGEQAKGWPCEMLRAIARMRLTAL